MTFQLHLKGPLEVLFWLVERPSPARARGRWAEQDVEDQHNKLGRGGAEKLPSQSGASSGRDEKAGRKTFYLSQVLWGVTLKGLTNEVARMEAKRNITGRRASMARPMRH